MHNLILFSRRLYAHSYTIIDRDEVSDLEAVQYRLNIYAGWYNTKRRHGGYKMHCTPRQKIEQWIINNKANELYEGNVNETLVLYTY